MAKAPLGVTVADTPGSKGKPLGIWPLEFTQRYSMQDSFIARVGGIRKTALKHLQHCDSQNTELQAGKGRWSSGERSRCARARAAICQMSL
jgi:hypothetical protein